MTDTRNKDPLIEAAEIGKLLMDNGWPCDGDTSFSLLVLAITIQLKGGKRPQSMRKAFELTMTLLEAKICGT